MMQNLRVQQYVHPLILSSGLTGLTRVKLPQAHVNVNLSGDSTWVRNHPRVV